MVSVNQVAQPTTVPVVQTVNKRNVNFKAEELTYGPKEVRDFPDRTEYVYETEASTGKKWGVGIASYFCPGLGQAINGQWGKCFAFLGGALGAGIFAGITKNVPLACLAAIGLMIGSIVDAVKNAKSTETVIMPKIPQQLPNQTPIINTQA